MLCFSLNKINPLVTPVNIAEFKIAQISDSNTKSGNYKEHSIISFAGRIAAINNRKQFQNFIMLPNRWNSCLTLYFKRND